METKEKRLLAIAKDLEKSALALREILGEKSEVQTQVELPFDGYNDLNKFYGLHGTPEKEPAGGLAWFLFPEGIQPVLYERDGDPLTNRDPSNGRVRHRCHKSIASRLTSALQASVDKYGVEWYYSKGLHVYGGCYNPRKMRGSSHAWSTHAWAIAIDINPFENPYSPSGRPERGNMPDEFINIMEEFGFLSYGRARGHDYMHFQAAIPSVIKPNSYYAEAGIPKNIKHSVN